MDGELREGGGVTRLCGIALLVAAFLLTATTSPHLAVVAGVLWLSLTLTG